MSFYPLQNCLLKNSRNYQRSTSLELSQDRRRSEIYQFLKVVKNLNRNSVAVWITETTTAKHPTDSDPNSKFRNTEKSLMIYIARTVGRSNSLRSTEFEKSLTIWIARTASETRSWRREKRTRGTASCSEARKRKRQSYPAWTRRCIAPRVTSTPCASDWDSQHDPSIHIRGE